MLHHSSELCHLKGREKGGGGGVGETRNNIGRNEGGASTHVCNDK